MQKFEHIFWRAATEINYFTSELDNFNEIIAENRVY